MTVALVYLREAGLAAARRGAPLYAGVGIVATVLFAGPNAMRAADAVGALDGSTPLRLGLWAAWLVATAPVVRLLFAMPSTFYLRTLPRTAPGLTLGVAVGLFGAESPWVALHARGAGVLAGVAALALAASLQAAWVARAPLLALPPLAALAGPLGWPVRAAVGLATLPLAAWHAHRRAPERAAAPARNHVGGPAPLALARAYLAAALRATPSAAPRALLVTGAGAALLILVGRANHVGASLAFALGFTSPALVVAAGGLAEAVVAVERDAAWLLASSGTPLGVRAAGRAAAAAAAGAVLGAGLAATFAVAVGGAALLVPALVAWGAALAALLTTTERAAADAERGRDGGRAAVLALAVAAAGAILGGWLGAAALALVVPLAAAASLLIP
jgi:hypothetical protein